MNAAQLLLLASVAIVGALGAIHIVYTFRRYTIKHAVFNEAWLTQVVRPN